MQPIPVPENVKRARPQLAVRRIGPPRGFSDKEVGTVEALVGYIDDMSAFCDYWKPSAADIEALQKGAFIELIQYTPQMMMHSMTIWPVSDDRA